MIDKIADTNRERFNRIDRKLDWILGAVEIFSQRVGSVEDRISGLGHSVAHVHERIDAVQKHIDRFDQRLGRIEERLELTTA